MRGEVWLVALDPTVGSETQKTRPCLIVSPDKLNRHLRTVIIAPLTTGSRPAAFRLSTTFRGKAGLILLDQARAVDRKRLVKSLGMIGAGELSSCLTLLRHIFSEE